jgi:arylsulfatase A-like enzyme
VQKLLTWIDQGPRDRPFFVMYLPIAGHHPYNAPGEGPRPYGERPDLDRYASDLYRGDAAFGALEDGIAARGLADRTLWVVMGDHGEAFFQHEGNFAHTLFLYEENVHVPLIVAAPGLTDRVVRAPQIGSTADVAPTLLDLTGIAAPERWQGRSLLANDPGVARFYTDHTIWQMGLRSGRWKLIHEVESGRSKLFDLAKDPGETVDLAASERERVRRYEAHLAGWGARARERVLGYRAIVGDRR